MRITGSSAGHGPPVIRRRGAATLLGLLALFATAPAPAEAASVALIAALPSGALLPALASLALGAALSWLGCCRLRRRWSARVEKLAGEAAREAEARRDAEERLRRVMGGARCLVWHAGVALEGGRFVWDLEISNPDAAMRLLGLAVPPGESAESAWRRSKQPEDIKRMDEISTAALRAGLPGYSQVFRCVTAGGELRWLYEDVQVERLDAERWRAVGVCTDITERKRTEDALADRMRLAAVTADVGVALTHDDTLVGHLHRCGEAIRHHLNLECVRVWILDREGSTLELQASVGDSRACDGSDRRIAVGSTWVGRVAAEGRPLHSDGAETGAEAGQCEGRAASAGYPLDVGGEVLGVLAVSGSEPLTETANQALASVADAIGLAVKRKLAERELRKLSRAVEQTASSVLITDRQGRIEYVNPRFTQLTGYRPHEVVGKRPSLLGSGRTPRQVYDDLWRTIMADGTWTGEFCNRKKNGDLYWELATVAPIHDTQGETTHFVSVGEEITNRKRVQEELERAKEAAEAASRAKSEFVASMSHEIRTPMNGVLGMLGLLLDTPLSGEQREYAETARASAESLLQIINDVLDFSKIEAGRVTIEPTPFDLLSLVEDVGEMMAGAAERKGVDLIVRYAVDGPRRLVGDAGRIRQVLVNLVGNAVKFTHRGHVLVDVTCRAEDDGSVRVGLAVEDTGIGIANEKRDEIFGKFTQADGSMTRRYGGTGLGLAISKELVELMGGEIGVESVPGEGSTFWFTLRLPIAAEEQPEDADRALAGLRVLVVDDNAVNRRVLQEQVARWRMRGDVCELPEEAIGVMRRAADEGDPYRIAILDHQMPGMDGETLGRLIRSERVLSGTILVMLTSVGRVGDRSRLLESGFSACLTKPARPSQLMDVLATAWGEHAAGAPSGASARPDAGREEEADTAARVPARARVLVAEDNVANQRVAVRMLEKLGCRVDVAANGREAVQMASALPYDLIFMDCQMPEMDGYEATAVIRRELGGERHLPIIAMTANAMQGDRERCLAAGMDDYVSKPVRLEDVDAALRHWYRRANGGSLPASLSPSGNGRGPALPPAGGGAGGAADRRAGSADGYVPGPALDATVISALRSLSDDGVTFLIEVVDAFREGVGEKLAEMGAAVGAGDATRLASLAHTLKGASGNIGARRVAALCQRIEDVLGGAGVTAAGELLDALERELRAAVRALDEEIERARRGTP